MDARPAFFALPVCAFGILAALLILPLVEYVLAACLLAVVLRPAYERLAPRVGPRPAAVALTGVAVGAGVVPLVVVSLVVLRSVASILAAVEGARVAAYGRDVARTELGVADESITAIESALLTELEELTAGAAEAALVRAVDLAATGVEAAVGVVVLAFLLYYLLIDGRAAVEWLRETVPVDARVLDELFAEVHVVTWAVLRSHVLVAVLQGLLGGAGLALLGVPYATTLSVLLVLAAVLPTVGVWLVWGPVTIAHAVSSDPVRAAALFCYGAGVLAVTDSYLRAVLVDRGSGLHPAIALLGVIGGLSLFGFVGVFVGPAVFAAFKAGVTVLNRLHRSELGDHDDRESRLAEAKR